ncbi:unnamed protein product [Allacma fusca]|uniref:(S)-2-hydroxy-acid oxidase n=1 Tax=Allacma fusca TaxID=39272 RepID=A0A8J2K2E3_9HEXA|nr:unnamed protein product [Allacma fusca]
MVKLQPDKDLEKLVCVKDFAADASNKLSKNALEYFQSGADDEVTLRENSTAFQRWKIIPRVFRDVSKRKISSTVLGKEVSIPVGVSPMGFQRVASFEGEIDTAKAAAAAGSIFTLSTFATTSIEDVAKAIPNGRKWLQLFIFANKAIVESLIRRAEENGFEAIVITVDSQYVGKRRANARKPFKLPRHLKIANFDPPIGLPEGVVSNDFSNISHLHNDLDFRMTWDIVHWLKKATKLPIILKGILSPKDAELAVENCVAGIWISNHGGRALDHGISTIDMLPQIREKVGNKIEVYIDGGIHKGSDVFKALALGANMVFMGRPFIWGLASGSEAGAKKIFEIIEEELDSTMALAGVKCISAIKDVYVANTPTMRCNL